jgi:competence protein ComEC
MWLGMVMAALGQLEPLGAPVAPLASAAAEALGACARLPIGYLGWIAERVADLPYGPLSLRLPSALALGAAYAALVAVALGARRLVRRVEPAASERAAGWRRLPRSRRMALAAAAGLALVLLAARAVAPPDPPSLLTVSFLDVGQGDATLIQHPDGTAMLFDGGPPEARIARLLRQAGVRRLAMVVATHASRDHHGGLAEVLGRYPVGLLLDGGDGTRDRAFGRVLATAADRGVRRVAATAPLTLRAGGLVVRVIAPAPRPPGPAPEDPNRRAVVAVVSAGDFDLLLSADAESESLSALRLPDVDAMKVPHHGSADPGLAEVLERLRPELAAIEVGENSYGHPAPSTLATLRRAGVRTYRTDRHGTVKLAVAADGGLAVETER